jgi:tetratricopeptide (TPR) repeat protein
MNFKIVKKSLFVLAVCSFIANGVFAQDCADFSAFPGGEEEGKKVHVLYHDLVKKENYEEAFPMWKELMENSPGGHVYHFIDGVTMYKAFIERDADDEAKVLEDKEIIVKLFEQRITCMSPERGDKGAVLENMAYSLSEIAYDNIKTLATYEAAIKENGNKTSAYILAYYADHAIIMYGNDLMEKDKVREIYMTLEAIKDANTDKAAYADNWAYVEDYYAPYVDGIFDCGFFMKKLKPEYEKDADNYEVFRPILKTLLQKGCSQDDPFIAELIVKDTKQGEIERQAAIEKWKTDEPDKYGLYLKSNGRADEAVEFLEKGIKMDVGAERLSDANYALAQIFHQKGQYAKARGYYTAAANNKSGWGEPYIEIGKMYAASVNSCGNGDGFQMGVIACAALDMWGKAKSVDGSVSGEANGLIGKYSAYVPTKEDAFQRGIKEGQSASVGCWIGGSATVRVRSQY